MLVVVGSPSARLEGGDVRADGIAAGVAQAAVAAGGSVQIVGRVGEDPLGDGVLLDLAAAGVGHVAVLRAAGEATPLALPPSGRADDAAPGEALAGDATFDPPSPMPAAGLRLDAADLELALRYLPDYRVIVAAADLDPAALTSVVAAASWSGARLVVLVGGDPGTPNLPPDATVLAQPADADEAFSAVVARYAVELDRGSEPAAAFAAASSGAGWQTVES
ncbi:MAG TPA: hypothetical protein VFI34_02665 [Candidatus Limnocylindrales bacterium]|nr:hypothetical protein [Candidatus Limnocylindrales bacterium]